MIPPSYIFLGRDHKQLLVVSVSSSAIGNVDEETVQLKVTTSLYGEKTNLAGRALPFTTLLYGRRSSKPWLPAVCPASSAL